MQYSIILTPKPSGGIHVSIPSLPGGGAEAVNRDEAILLARKAIVDFMSHSEVIYVDIPNSPELTHTVPWEWFGIGQEQPDWETLFDQIEQRRETTRELS